MDLKIIYEDKDVLVVDKPAGMVVFPEGQTTEKTVINYLIEKYPDLKHAGEAPRYGVVHRLDKDTSGVLLVAKSTEALIFLQKQFSAGAKALADKKNMQSIFPSRVRGRKTSFSSSHLLGNSEPLEKTLEKRYIALATGIIKDDSGIIHTLIGRSPADPRKQKAYELTEKKVGLRQALTEYTVLERFEKYTLLQIQMKTGRKHQIRAHLAHIHHPIAGDTLYSFKDSPTPKGLTRQFLHASYIKIVVPGGQVQEFNSPLPEELQTIVKHLDHENND